MSTETSSFPTTSKEEWINILTKELKGAPIDSLHKQDEIEDLNFNAYMHETDKFQPFSDPGLAPYVRGVKQENNEWIISCSVYLREDFSETESNAFILDQLMKGSTGIYVIAETEREIDFSKLFAEVGLEFIYPSFEAKTTAQANAFKVFLGSNAGTLVFSENQEIITINAYLAQQSGANATQELVVALSEGHEALVKQLDAGKSVDEACKNIQFNFGVGTKYLVETAKFRAFRWCWSTLVGAYKPEHECSKSARIVAKTGFTHLSLQDPFTNLLRQTTQAMSAINGGVDELVLQPYDAYSSEFNPIFTQRMATNISLLLQEESFFSKVSDVAGGSYAIDFFTKTLAQNAWKKFKEIEVQGGLDNEVMVEQLKNEIKATAQLRVHRLQEKKDKLIGINIFPNPKTETGHWNSVPAGWKDLPTLLLDTVL